MVTVPKNLAYALLALSVIAFVWAVQTVREHNRLCVEYGIARIPSPGEDAREIFPEIPGWYRAGSPDESPAGNAGNE